MRQVEKERKKFQSRIPLILDPGKKIPKKIANKFKKLRILSPVLFLAKEDEIGQEREKKILVPNSVHTRPPARKFRKKTSKKIQKSHSGIIFQGKRNEIGRERGNKILVPNSIHSRPEQENSKKIAKKFKKLKNPFPALFLAKTGLDRPRKRKKKKKFSP